MSADTLAEFVLTGRDPDALAVDGAEPLTYGELGRRVEEYGKRLAKLDLEVGTRVVVESHTSGSAIAMLLACAQTGVTFIPVTPDTPDLRLRSIVEMTEPALHLRADGTPDRDLPVASGVFGSDGLRLDRVPPRRPRYRRGPVGTDAAYIVFTSGTTGRPKGVVISHHAAMAFYRGAHRFGLVAAEDRVASTAPLSFDVSLFDMAVTLGAGATLLPVPREFLSFPRRLCDFLRRNRASSLHAVPSILLPLIRREPDELAALSDLRKLMITGEDFPLDDLRRLQELRPGLRIVNAFGATETVAFSFAEVPDPLPPDAERLSIGRGYPGGEMVLIDEHGRPVDRPGEVGEIHVYGPSKFNGYWGDPAATAEVLIPDPLDPRSGQLVYKSGDLAYRGQDGQLYFCGRADSMVKIRGNRVELGEIERRLAEHPAVAEVVVLVDKEADELAAFVVLKSQSTVGELVGWCRAALPEYMVPRRIQFLEALPLTANGKIDRVALSSGGRK